MDEHIHAHTDKYFVKTRKIVGQFGDVDVTYAVFMRRPVIFTPRLAVAWLEEVTSARGKPVAVELLHPEGAWVGAGEPLMYLKGSMQELVDLETLFLQKLGAPCVAAFNAYTMCTDLPYVGFLAMDARHCAGAEMADLMAYAASVGSARARRKHGAAGFVGNATDATAHFFGQAEGLGTMPHAIIGYAGSTVRAAEMFHEAFPEQQLVVLVDYYAREISGALEVCRRFPELARDGRISVRLDTPGSRYVEGLDPPGAYAVMDRNAPDSIRGYR
ncbi:MAG: nicotinate phosphoribosyltransferase, partial [Geminicoccaceae bacterium]